MFFQVIRGRAKSGKSTYCIEQMKKISKQTGSSVLMIVPEQFSYAAEKRLVLAMGGTGINQCEVLTLSRLAHRMLDESRPYIKPAGKQMLLYKSIEMAKKENNIFHKSLSKPGFLDVAAETISEMKRYGISPDFLMEKAQEMDEGMLKFKLDVISRIYKGYADMLSDRFIDSDDDLERLAQYIQKSSNFSDAYIWIDEFSDFLPQHYKVIAALMEKAKGVFVTLCMDEEEDVLSAFSPCVKSLYRLKDIADEIGCPRLDDVYLCRKQKYKSDELMFLEENWDNPKANVYTGRTEAISLFEARDIYSEAEHTAIEILKLVRQEGYRFRDIGILVGSLDDYHHILEVVFAAYNVPYFTDKKTAVTDHAIILLVLSIFDIFSGGFSYESVFRYLKTGFAGICDEEIDLLENYVLERGIRGKKAWMSDEPWENGNLGVFDAVLQIKSGEEDYTIDNIRKKVIAPFMEFEKNFEGRKTIKQICTALFEFLDKGIGLADKINACVEEFISAGHMSEAEQFKQIWNILIDVLDQLVAVMGDDLCGMERFGELIRTGLSKYEIGIIPSAVDQVSIGTIDRSKSTDVKVLFIMGAVYGKIPNTSLKEGILSDRDRRILAKYGMEVAPDTRAKVFDEQFKVYKAVTAASEKLYISFPVADTEGKAQRSAYLVADIKRLFPNLKQRDNLLLDIREDFNLAAAPEPAFYHMIAVLSKGAPYHSVWDDAYAWYAEHDEWKDKLNIIERAKQYKNTSAMLDIEKVNKLYGENPVYSISRLETFSQCQFRYFLEHGLKARERRVWSVKSFDIGNLMHYVIRQFCMNVEKNSHTLADIKKDWHELTDEASEAIIRTLMKEAEEKIMSSQPQDSGRIKFLLSQIENTLRRSVKMIAESLQMGEFAAVGYEQAFSDFEIACGNGRKIKLRGIIDRIDLLETNDRAYIRIIDYKSGSKIFDIKRIYNNLDFQLMIYAQAAVELYKCGRLLSKQGKPVQIAGVLYCTLKDPMVFVSGPHDIDENEIKKQIKLNGLLLDDIKIIRMMDRRVASETAEELIARGIKKKDIDLRSESGYLNVTTTKTTGELSKKSSLASEQNIRCLADYVNRSIAHVDEKIKNGYIGISPFKESDAKNACTYCPYGEVCLFDAAADKYRLPKKLKDDIWDSFAMGGESDGEMDK